MSIQYSVIQPVFRAGVFVFSSCLGPAYFFFVVFRASKVISFVDAKCKSFIRYITLISLQRMDFNR